MTEAPCSSDGRKAHDGQRRKAGLRRVSRALTTLLAVAAFGLSYSHTVAWFAGHGQENGKYILAAIPEISLIMCVITCASERPKALRAWLIGALAAGSFGITITANLAAASAGAGGVVAALVAPLAAIIMMALEVSHGATPPAAQGAPAAHPFPAVAPAVPQRLNRLPEPAAQGVPSEPLAHPSPSPTEPVPTVVELVSASAEPVPTPSEPPAPDAPPVRQRVTNPDRVEQLKGQTALFDSSEDSLDQGDPTPIGKSADKASAVQWIKSQPVTPSRADIEKRYRVSKATANRWLSESTAA
ncbi:MAG: hypothetical protein ACRC0L_02235 [Angustibacter sp.]